MLHNLPFLPWIDTKFRHWGKSEKLAEKIRLLKKLSDLLRASNYFPSQQICLIDFSEFASDMKRRIAEDEWMFGMDGFCVKGTKRTTTILEALKNLDIKF